MNIFINGTEFKLTARGSLPGLTPAAVIIEGTSYNVDDNKRLHMVAPKKAHRLTFRWLDNKRPLPHQVTVLDRVWQYDENGTYSRKLDLQQDPTTIITINEMPFELRAHPSPKPLVKISVDGFLYEANGADLDRLQRFNLLEELRITGVHFEQEITIFHRVWSCSAGDIYRPKVESAKPFPQAGQTVILDGVEVEVLHLDRGIVFWYNSEDEIHGMVQAEKLKSSLAETMRADLAKGLGPKELIAIGWSREIN
jgi:hypothetical protein